MSRARSTLGVATSVAGGVVGGAVLRFRNPDGLRDRVLSSLLSTAALVVGYYLADAVARD